MKRPELAPKKMKLNIGYTNQLLGLDLKPREIIKLLQKMRYSASGGKEDLVVEVPAYRTDILHPMDLVEDVAIAYGYQNFTPEVPRLYTTASTDSLEEYCYHLRELFIGAGYTEVMTLTLTDPDRLFAKMLLEPEPLVETVKSVSAEHGAARNWLLPSLMEVLESNRNREYPQKIFEVGECVTGNGKNTKRLAAVHAGPRANYSSIHAEASGILDSLGLEYSTKPVTHPSFIPGRCGQTRYCFYGELHPQVLENHGLAMPVTALEMDLDKAQAGKK